VRERHRGQRVISSHWHQLKWPALDPQVDRKGQPYYTTDQPSKLVETKCWVCPSPGVVRATFAQPWSWCAWATARDRPYYTTDQLGKPVYSRGDPLRSPWRLYHSFPPRLSFANKVYGTIDVGNREEVAFEEAEPY